MRTELVGSSVVIVANRFNPSVVSQLWLVRNGLLAEDELAQGSIFADPLVQVLTPHFILVLTPEQMQFIPTGPEGDRAGLIADKVGRLVELLPQTPYRALGLNFTYHLRPEAGDVRQLARRLFFKDGTPIFREFDCDDANFGAYLSKDALGFRLKLDMKPMNGIDKEGQTVYFFQVLFNFHADLEHAVGTVEHIRTLLGRWGEAADEAARLAARITEGT